MLAEIFFTTLLHLVSRTKTCEFNRQDILNYELSYLKGSASIEVNAPDARLISCKPWSEFPYLLVVELDLGSGGATSNTHETSLFIFDTLSKDLREVFNRKIRESSVKKSAKKGEVTESIVWENPYKLVKTAIGKPGIRWTKSSELVTLD